MKIPHSQPYFDQKDELSVLETIRGGFVSHGEKSRELGKLGAKLLERRWGIATQSGTDALTAALRILDLPPGSKVIVPAYICSAPLDALAAAQLIPEPVDIDRQTLGLQPELVNRSSNTKAVIAAHLFGIPMPVDKINHQNIIEDCAQTLSDGKTVSVGRHGRLVACSFYATKLLTTGHGGLLAGDDEALLKSANFLMTHDKQDSWSQHMHFHLSDLNAALGLTQVGKLPWFIQERKKIAARFLIALGESPKLSSGIYSRFLVIPRGTNSDLILNLFQAAGIEAKKPVYKALFNYLGFSAMEFPNSQWAEDNLVSVPIYPGMPENYIQHIESFLEKNKDDLCRWPSA